MKIIKTNLNGLFIIEPDVFGDERGYFFESFNRNRFQLNNLDVEFVQDNISKSKKDTIRGLHYQVNDKAQGKLCFVISGAVLDVAVDIRFDSPTFGKHFSQILSEENHLQMWIPPGFAHGFSVLSDYAIFMYKCTLFYDKDAERAIYYADPQLNINWMIDDPIVSEKDKNAKLFREIDRDFKFVHIK